MKILFITAFPPSTIGAGVNYTRQLLEELSKKHMIDLIYFKSNKEDSYVEPNDNIKVCHIFKISFIKKLLHAFLLPFIFPLFTAKFSFKNIFVIKKILNKKDYDLVYYDFSQTFLYSLINNTSQKVLMSHDVIAQRYERINKFMGVWAKLCEKHILNKNTNTKIFTFSSKDSNILLKEYRIPSYPTSFYFSDIVENTFPTQIEDYFTFFAMWKRSDNHRGLKWFLEEVMPFMPDLNIKIIGAYLPDNIKAICKKYPNVVYLGFLDNPYPIIANSKALISPLFKGAGVKVKVLDALALGTPVIGTSISFEGIDSKYKDLMFMANTQSDFIHAIKEINVGIDKRLEIKETFLKESKEKQIIKFINTI